MLKWMKGPSAKRVMFGTNWPMLAPQRCLDGLPALGLNDEQRDAFLGGNARRVFALETGNGQLVAFLAESRATVDQAYSVALANGATSEGGPGLRPEDHAHYYGAYFRDTEGNKLCVACHAAPSARPKQPWGKH